MLAGAGRWPVKTLFAAMFLAGNMALAEKHPAGRAVNPTNAVRDTGTPFHPGAVRYYSEIGIWPDATAEGEAG